MLVDIWEFTGEYATEGDIGKLSNDEIANVLEWDGNADELVAALVLTGWLDECSERRLVVHDWLENCDEWVKKRLSRTRKGNVSRHCPDNVETTSRHVATTSDVLGKDREGKDREGKEGIRKGEERELPEALRTPELDASWSEWLKHRREKGSAVKPGTRTWSRQVNLIERIGPDRAIAAIEHSITQGYSGLFEPKGNGQQLSEEQEAARKQAEHEEFLRKIGEE